MSRKKMKQWLNKAYLVCTDAANISAQDPSIHRFCKTIILKKKKRDKKETLDYPTTLTRESDIPPVGPGQSSDWEWKLCKPLGALLWCKLYSFSYIWSIKGKLRFLQFQTITSVNTFCVFFASRKISQVLVGSP